MGASLGRKIRQTAFIEALEGDELLVDAYCKRLFSISVVEHVPADVTNHTNASCVRPLYSRRVLGPAEFCDWTRFVRTM